MKCYCRLGLVTRCRLGVRKYEPSHGGAEPHFARHFHLGERNTNKTGRLELLLYSCGIERTC